MVEKSSNAVHALSESESERNAALIELCNWSYDPARQEFYRCVILQDFSEAFALMTRIALEADKVDHHPEWCNVYNRLEIWLTTHDAGGVSKRDVAFVRTIDGLIYSVAD